MKSIIIGALCGILLVCLGSWIAGFDFDSRGSNAFWVFYLSCSAGLIGGMVGNCFNFE